MKTMRGGGGMTTMTWMRHGRGRHEAPAVGTAKKRGGDASSHWLLKLMARRETADCLDLFPETNTEREKVAAGRTGRVAASHGSDVVFLDESGVACCLLLCTYINIITVSQNYDM